MNTVTEDTREDMPEVAIPHLPHQGLPQIQKIVLCIVCCLVRVFRSEVVRCNPVFAHDALSGTESPDEEFVQHVKCTL